MNPYFIRNMKRSHYSKRM